MRNRFINLLISVFFAIGVQAQIIKNHEISFSIGVIDEYFEPINNHKYLDFINYIDDYPGEIEFVILKIDYKFDFLSKMSADIKLILMDAIIPDNFDISVYYNLNNKLAVGGGSFINKTYITGFEEYQIQTLATTYYTIDHNVQQFVSYSWGLYALSFFKLIDNERFKIRITCDLGMISYLKNHADFYHKKILSNERMQYHYKTKLSFQAFVRPQLDISLRIFKFKETSVGLFVNTNYLYSKRRIKYNRTIEKWTSANYQSEEYKMPKHDYSLFEISTGVFIRW